MNLTEEEIKLRQAWASELLEEHESICWQYKVDLYKPIIEISNSKTEWGSWDPDFRTMKVSSALIKEHSWDVTVNVFKHEMAHQIVTDIFNRVDGHGELFHTACKMIGVPKEFRGSRGDVPRKIVDFRDQAIDSDNVRMLEKVEKLLSLAQSKNENEAFLAMKKANELIEKYNIDRMDQKRASKYVYAIISHRKKRLENYQRRIGVILKEHFFVEVVYSYIYDAGDCQTYRAIELLGTVENVLIAEYVYWFLLNQLGALWNVHKFRKGDCSSKNKRSYWLGVLKGFEDKLGQQAEDRNRYNSEGRGTKTMSAVICAEDKLLAQFMKMRFPRLSRYRSRGANIDHRTYQAGIDEGKRLNIHKGINQNDGFQGKLLIAKSG